MIGGFIVVGQTLEGCSSAPPASPLIPFGINNALGNPRLDPTT